MNKKLLAVIDMQNDFIDGALGTEEARKIVPSVRARILSARKAGEEVVYTRDTHGADYLSTEEGKNLPVPHCIKGSAGWQISEEIPVFGEIVDKPTFGSTALAQKVKDGGYERVELIGLCTDICVISNALLIKAFCPELPVRVDAACCAGVTPQSHENALKAMEMCQIDVIRKEIEDNE